LSRNEENSLPSSSLPESVFYEILYHKLGTFSSREDDLKKAKDLYYAYSVLRFSPDPAELNRHIRLYRRRRIFPHVESELRSFFGTLTSQGSLWIEKENGPDEFVENVRRDAYVRFTELLRDAFERSSDPKEA
jgi:hypothetical protein